MKKQMKSLLIGVGAVAVLGAAAAVVMNLPDAAETESSSSSQSSSQAEKIYLLDFETEDLKSIEIQNTESYVINRVEGGNNEWIINELEGLPKRQNSYAFLALNLGDTEANSLLAENVTDLKQYGLDKPAVTVTAVLYDGSRQTLLLGDEAPGGSFVYGKKPDSNDVYLISNAEVNRLYQVKTDYLAVSLFELEDNSTLPGLYSMTLGGSLRPEEIEIADIDAANGGSSSSSQTLSLGNSYRMLRPKEKDVNTTAATETFQTIFETVVTGIAVYNPTQEQIEEYGLDVPESTVTVQFYEGDYSSLTPDKIKTTSYRASKKSGKMYLMREEIPIIYEAEISTEFANTWYDVAYDKLSSRLFLLPYINDVRELTVTTPDKTYTFDLVLADAGTEDEKLNILHEGKILDEKVFKQFYQLIIGSTSETVEEIPENRGTPLLTYTFRYHSKNDVDVMKFYEGPTRLVYVEVNGECEFATRAAYVEKIYEAVEQVLAGETINTNY